MYAHIHVITDLHHRLLHKVTEDHIGVELVVFYENNYTIS